MNKPNPCARCGSDKTSLRNGRYGIFSTWQAGSYCVFCESCEAEGEEYPYGSPGFIQVSAEMARELAIDDWNQTNPSNLKETENA